MKVSLKRRRGQTLLEMVIAFLVATLVVIALVTVTIRAIRNAQIAKNRTEAARYAQEAIERVRVVRDQQGWGLFSSYNVSPPGNCYKAIRNVVFTDIFMLGNVGCGVGEPLGRFKRIIYLTADSDDPGTPELNEAETGRNVKVVISWSDASGAQTTTLDTKLTKWQ